MNDSESSFKEPSPKKFRSGSISSDSLRSSNKSFSNFSIEDAEEKLKIDYLELLAESTKPKYLLEQLKEHYSKKDPKYVEIFKECNEKKSLKESIFERINKLMNTFVSYPEPSFCNEAVLARFIEAILFTQIDEFKEKYGKNLDDLKVLLESSTKSEFFQGRMEYVVQSVSKKVKFIVVEAKKHDFKRGLIQLTLAMDSLHKENNKKNEKNEQIVHGFVTDAETWLWVVYKEGKFHFSHKMVTLFPGQNKKNDNGKYIDLNVWIEENTTVVDVIDFILKTTILGP